MNFLSKHQLGIKYQNYMFVNTMISNPAIKTVSKYILNKTWDGKLWNAEIIENEDGYPLRIKIKDDTSAYSDKESLITGLSHLVASTEVGKFYKWLLSDS